jgi:hypothetical protein
VPGAFFKSGDEELFKTRIPCVSGVVTHLLLQGRSGGPTKVVVNHT